MYGALKAEILCESTFSERSHNAQYNIKLCVYHVDGFICNINVKPSYLPVQDFLLFLTELKTKNF